jgi:hypothetical protein
MFKKLFLALLLAAPVFGGSLQPDRSFANNKGLLDRTSPLQRPDGTASVINNITLDNRGELDKRNGYTFLGNLNASPVTGGEAHTYNDGHTDFIVIIGTGIYRTTNTFGSTYTDITGTNTITATASNQAQSAGLNDVHVFCNQTDQPFYVPTTGNAIPLYNTLFQGAKACTTYGSYLVIANTKETSVVYASRIRWSDINSPNSFPVLNFIDIEPNDGDKIVSLVSFGDSVYIFKQRSIYQMAITGLDGPDAFIIRPLARNIGAWAKNSVKVVPGQGVFLLAQNTVYQISATGGIVPIGDPIQITINSISRAMWANAVAAVYPKRNQYWVAVSTTSDSINHLVLVYDYIQRSWTTYSGMNVNMLSQALDSTGDNVLISGDYVGNVYKQDTGTSDNPAGVATAINASYTTADLVFSSPEITKNFKYLYIFTQVDQTTTLTVEAAFDYSSSFDYVKSVDLGQAGYLYDSSMYDSATYPAVLYKVSRLEINRSARAIKLRFSNASASSIVGVIGWANVYSLEDWRQ